jgi:hypothetical protein
MIRYVLIILFFAMEGDLKLVKINIVAGILSSVENVHFAR